MFYKMSVIDSLEAQRSCELVYNSELSTEQLIKLAELCEFGLEYGCVSVDEFLQQQFLFGCDVRYEVVKHIVRYVNEDATYDKLLDIYDFVTKCGYDDDEVMDLCNEAAIKLGDTHRNLILVNITDGKYIQELI